MFNFMLARPDL